MQEAHDTHQRGVDLVPETPQYEAVLWSRNSESSFAWKNAKHEETLDNLSL
jgi:hypothetical protein